MIHFLRRTWKTLCFKPWTVSIGLFVLLGLSFALLIPQLGFYWDDWPVIMMARQGDLQRFWPFYAYDRPISAWTYVLTVPLLGVKPLNWQIFTLVVRWITCVLSWWSLRLVWPGQKRLAASAAFLFAIYPVFTQQAISVAYSQHWICYLLFLLSIAAMLQAERSPRWFWPLTGISLLAFLTEILTMEYFAGLELLRPLLLWLVVSEQPRTRLAQWKSVFLRWLPYLAGLIAFAVWRLFFLQLPGADANTPSLLYGLTASPLQTTRHLIQISLQDLLHLLVRSWSQLIDIPSIDLSDRFMLASWALGILVFLGTLVFFNRLAETNDVPLEGRARSRVVFQGILVGFLAVILGALPVWLTDRQVIAGMYADRFGLAAMWGASLFLASLVEWLIEDRRKQILLISLMIGLAVGFHLQKANDYRWSWVKQTRFYWQLKWRAPEIASHTGIFSDGEIFMYMGLYPTSAAVNTLYGAGLNNNTLDYWFYSLNRDFAYNIRDFGGGLPLKSTIRNYTFQGNTRQGIAIVYSEDNDCLEVLAPGDETTPGLDPLSRQALKVSDLSRITAGPGAGSPPEDIFGPEPEHGWCYFYEKASLARQQNDWDQVIRLGDQARALGFQPGASASNTPFEWLPFIEGYAHDGRWQEAQSLSLAAYEKSSQIDAQMCSLWKTLISATPASPERDVAAAAVQNTISCPH